MRTVLIVTSLALSLPSVAFADCEAPYTIDNLLQDLVTAEDAIRRYDAELAKGAAKSLEGGLACMEELVPSMMVDRVYRAIGGGLVLGSDAADGMKWFRTAAQLNPTFEYGLEDLDAEHSLRFVYDQARKEADADDVRLDQNFADGTWYLNGRQADVPESRPNRFHLLQQDSSGINSWVVDGTSFPEVALAPVVAEVEPEEPEKKGRTKKEKPPKAEKAPKVPKEKPEKVAKASKPPKEKPQKTEKAGKAAAGTSSSTVVLQRERPPEKTPLMIAGGVLIAGAGGLYYWSYMARQDFDSATTTEDVQAAADLNRALVVASGATLAVGLGVGVWGIVLDGGGPVIGPRVNLRW